MRKALPIAVVLLLSAFHCYTQDGTGVIDKITNFPNKIFGKINDKVSGIDKQLDKQTEKCLKKLDRQEARLKNKFYTFDSSAAKNLFASSIDQQYALRLQQLKTDTAISLSKTSTAYGEYYPNVDSLLTSLSFLKQNPDLLDPSKIAPADIQGSLDKLQMVQAKLQDADQLKQFIQERKDQIKLYLARYSQIPSGIMSTYNNYNKQLYYYGQQVKEYKDMLDDPDKLMKTALQLLNKLPAFSTFIRNNSMLASLFNLPGTAGSAQVAIGQGLPSRDQVIAAFQGESGVGGGPNLSSTVQQNVESAQGQAAQLQDKVSSIGSGNSADIDIPDFKPNTQKTKSFFKRLVYGSNLQTVRSSLFFPATSDLGLSIGYKLNDNNEVGLGASYKIGWGSNISHINISGQGASLRSYGDFRIKKSWFASGGFEYNYQQAIIGLVHIPDIKFWQQSGLLGISKIISIKTKFLKSSKFQVLWDFLSYQQVPKAQPIKFRIGYSF